MPSSRSAAAFERALSGFAGTLNLGTVVDRTCNHNYTAVWSCVKAQ